MGENRGVTWDPDRYLQFADKRTRPGLELIARIPDTPVGSIVDLGAGTGHLTAVLARRWPEASIKGVDLSDEMIERARTEHPSIEWHRGDVAAWEPEEPVDLIFSNATLHWLDNHELLFRKLRSYAAPGGVIAVQMPDNWGEPTHLIPASVLDDGGYPDTARTVLLRDRISPPVDYMEWMQPADVDMWRTTYYQQFSGDNPVWDWVSGSLLRPILDVLDRDTVVRFKEEVVQRYRQAYPALDGSVVVPFSRVFIVAAIPAG